MPEQSVWRGFTTSLPDEEIPDYYEEDLCNCEDCRRDRGEIDDPEPVHEQSTDDLPAESPAIVIPGNLRRPSRMISCEQEVGSGGKWLAENLCSAGLSGYSGIVPYHCSEENDFLCSVEQDSSVEAEVIYSKLRLDTSRRSREFGQALGIVRDGMKQDIVTLDSRCGFHVHVGVGNDGRNKCWSMDCIESLYHLGNYVEDFLFRIGSANWPWHRSEAPSIYENYSPPSPKGLNGKPAIGQRMQNHRGAISYQHFLGSRDYCRCGAFMFSDWSECTCTNLRKPTIEFRVFNATANHRKIRAYIALCLGLVAYAEQNTVEDMAVYEWTGTSKMSIPKSKEVFGFLLDNLYWTDQERNDLYYCVEKSSLRSVL